MNIKTYYVYILASKKNGVLYVGVTNNLIIRTQNHKRSEVGSFTARYNVKKLVYFESTDDVQVAITREKQLKNWHRQWKINLIEKENPEWMDLYNQLTDPETSSG